jgi:plastocyanin
VTSSELLLNNRPYTVHFPTAGNFKFVCLIHVNMTGVVHVLDVAETLPYDQASYSDQISKEKEELLADGMRLERRAANTVRHASENEVTAGTGEIIATAGGSHTVSVMSYLPESIVVHVGDTVEWANLDPVVLHTVTFGAEPSTPPGAAPASANVTVDVDGARHATLGPDFDADLTTIHSGFLVAAAQDRAGTAQSPQPTTRFRVTFTKPGTFQYICTVHDELGMKGQVIVRDRHP